MGVQILALMWFFSLYIWLSINVARDPSGPDYIYHRVYNAPIFRRFVLSLGAAAALLLVYTIYRMIEMLGGLNGSLFQDQIAFMIMNGLLPFLSAALLAIFNPGQAFTLSVWSATSPRYGRTSRYFSSPFTSPSSTDHHTHNILSHNAHIRYDPNIRSRHRTSDHPSFSPYDSQSQSTPKYGQTPHDIQSRLGSPGLPSHPRMIRELTERRASSASCLSDDAAAAAAAAGMGYEKWPLSALTAGSSSAKDGAGRGSMEFMNREGGHGEGEKRLSDRKAKPKMVDSEAIW